MEMSSKPNELKPCPFCGGKNIKAVALGEKSHVVYCTDCGGGTKASYCTKDDAIKAWNRRAHEKENN